LLGKIKKAMESKEQNKRVLGIERPLHRVRMPAFIKEEDVGLGDAVKRVTYAMGIKPCERCDKRAAALNRWMVFTR
jgi:hypothetical protein